MRLCISGPTQTRAKQNKANPPPLALLELRNASSAPPVGTGTASVAAGIHGCAAATPPNHIILATILYFWGNERG